MDRGAIADAAQILVPRFPHNDPAVHKWTELVAEKLLGRCSDQRFGEVVILDEEEPLPVRPREVGISLLVQRHRGEDVEHGSLPHGSGVIQRHAMDDPRASVVTDDHEAIVPRAPSSPRPDPAP
jgi:hypothetical protein